MGEVSFEPALPYLKDLLQRTEADELGPYCRKR